MSRAATALLALLGVGAAVTAYSVTQVQRHGCIVPLCAPAGASANGARPEHTGFPVAVEGFWTGSISQSDGRAWHIELRLNAGATIGTVLYRELGCTGTLTFVTASADTVKAREHITAGDCTPDGSVTLAVGADRLTMTYTPDGEVYTATGRLSRTAQPT